MRRLLLERMGLPAHQISDEAVELVTRVYGWLTTPRSPIPFDRPHMTLEEVARELNISKQAVQQTERRALAKCAAYLRKQGISPEDLLG